MTYGEKLVHLVDAVYAADNQEDGKRRHLGASVIGNKCLRAVWYSWLWADREPFEGRMLRLFNRGHNQEEIFADLLRGIGARVWTADKDGKQFKVSTHGGHCGGSLDGVAVNLPDLPEGLPPETPVLLEFKTHNDKWFKSLIKKKVREGFPKHYNQSQFYMKLMGLEWCLYCAVNKNDDSLYFEFFQIDYSVGTYLLNRAETVIFGQGVPPRISENSGWFECRFCAFNGVCFKYKEPNRNCRTCVHSKAERDGSWSCALRQAEIVTQPKEGCDKYQVNPLLC